MAAKFSDDEAAVIDAARGEVNRSEWLRTAALAAAGKPAGKPGPAHPVASPGRVRFREPTPAGQCPPHPKARVIKGFCHACGRSVLND